jgi:hypothetical protein
MVTANTSARAFYDGLGFHVIPVRDPGPLTYLGLTLSGPGADGVCRTGHQGTQLRA